MWRNKNLLSMNPMTEKRKKQTRSANKTYYSRHKEKFKEAYRKKKEAMGEEGWAKLLENRREYYANNRERLRANHRTYRQNNLEKYRLRGRIHQYRENNPEYLKREKKYAPITEPEHMEMFLKDRQRRVQRIQNLKEASKEEKERRIKEIMFPNSSA